MGDLRMSLRKKNYSNITLAKKSWGECWTSSRGDGENRGERILRNTRTESVTNVNCTFAFTFLERLFVSCYNLRKTTFTMKKVQIYKNLKTQFFVNNALT